MRLLVKWALPASHAVLVLLVPVPLPWNWAVGRRSVRPNHKQSINISFDHTTLRVCQKGPLNFLLCVIDARLALVSLCLKMVLLELVHLSHDGLKNGCTAHTIVRKPSRRTLVDTNLSMSSLDSSGARCSYRSPHLNLALQNAGEHLESVC